MTPGPTVLHVFILVETQHQGYRRKLLPWFNKLLPLKNLVLSILN